MRAVLLATLLLPLSVFAEDPRRTPASADQQKHMQEVLLRTKAAIRKSDAKAIARLVRNGSAASLERLSQRSILVDFDPTKYKLLTSRVRGEFGALYFSAPAEPGLLADWENDPEAAKLARGARMLVFYRFQQAETGWRLYGWSKRGPSIAEAKNSQIRDVAFKEDIRVFDPDPAIAKEFRKARSVLLAKAAADAANPAIPDGLVRKPASGPGPAIQESVTVNRAALASLKEGADFFKDVRVVPNFQNGAVDGLKFDQMTPQCDFIKLGFREGDVLLAVDEVATSNVAGGLALRETLAKAKEVRFRLRDTQGKVRALHVELK